MYHLLIVEDDPTQANDLARQLEDFGYKNITIAHNYDAALAAFNQNTPFDLVLLDLGLGDPVLDGLAVCQKIRARPNPPPIIMLTVLGGEADMIKGLDLGASDYITKPYSEQELRARIKSVLRTVIEARKLLVVETPQRPLLEIDKRLQIDRPKRKAYLDGAEVKLRRREFDLLLFLADHPGDVFSREELLDKVWGMASGYGEETVTRHIASLRRKLKDDSRHPRYIFTEPGGYKFCEWRR